MKYMTEVWRTKEKTSRLVQVDVTEDRTEWTEFYNVLAERYNDDTSVTLVRKKIWDIKADSYGITA